MIRAKSTLSTPRCASTVSDPVPPVSPACSVPPFFGFPAAAGLELVDEGVDEEPHAASAVAPPTATTRNAAGADGGNIMRAGARAHKQTLPYRDLIWARSLACLLPIAPDLRIA